jgi:hypothetical protein
MIDVNDVASCDRSIYVEQYDAHEMDRSNVNVRISIDNTIE